MGARLLTLLLLTFAIFGVATCPALPIKASPTTASGIGPGDQVKDVDLVTTPFLHRLMAVQGYKAQEDAEFREALLQFERVFGVPTPVQLRDLYWHYGAVDLGRIYMFHPAEFMEHNFVQTLLPDDSQTALIMGHNVGDRWYAIDGLGEINGLKGAVYSVGAHGCDLMRSELVAGSLNEFMLRMYRKGEPETTWHGLGDRWVKLAEQWFAERGDHWHGQPGKSYDQYELPTTHQLQLPQPLLELLEVADGIEFPRAGIVIYPLSQFAGHPDGPLVGPYTSPQYGSWHDTLKLMPPEVIEANAWNTNSDPNGKELVGGYSEFIVIGETRDGDHLVLRNAPFNTALPQYGLISRQTVFVVSKNAPLSSARILGPLTRLIPEWLGVPVTWNGAFPMDPEYVPMRWVDPASRPAPHSDNPEVQELIDLLGTDQLGREQEISLAEFERPITTKSASIPMIFRELLSAWGVPVLSHLRFFDHREMWEENWFFNDPERGAHSSLFAFASYEDGEYYAIDTDGSEGHGIGAIFACGWDFVNEGGEYRFPHLKALIAAALEEED